MANYQESPNIRNPQPIRKSPVLPPKIPYQSTLPFPDYNLGNFLGPIGMSMHREGLKLPQHHQRTNSESFIVEEQPSWLDDLLDEPEMPVKVGAHRRSTSDSFAYLDKLNDSWDLDHLQIAGYKNQNVGPLPWGAEEMDCLKDIRNHPAHNMEIRPMGHDHGIKRVIRPAAGFQLPPASMQGHPMFNYVHEKQIHDEFSLELAASSEKREMSQAKSNLTDLEAKRAKQQFAQRSRVRKLQYIAELERQVQALQAEGMEFSAQLQFLDQQNLMLSLENKVLKQQLDNLSQEHLVKCLQQEMLEREISRLRTLYQQQQQPPPPIHRRSKSRDLESQLANLTLKQNDTN